MGAPEKSAQIGVWGGCCKVFLGRGLRRLISGGRVGWLRCGWVTIGEWVWQVVVVQGVTERVKSEFLGGCLFLDAVIGGGRFGVGWLADVVVGYRVGVCGDGGV